MVQCVALRGTDYQVNRAVTFVLCFMYFLWMIIVGPFYVTLGALFLLYRSPLPASWIVESDDQPYTVPAELTSRAMASIILGVIFSVAGIIHFTFGPVGIVSTLGKMLTVSIILLHTFVLFTVVVSFIVLIYSLVYIASETDTDKIDYYNEQIDSYGREHLLRQMRPTLHYMDFLQASFRCCGNTEPRDWMKNPAGAKFTVPDSCCTFETRMKDCGKGAITPNSVIPAHIYNQGCFMKAKEFASLVTTLLIVMLVLELIIGVVLVWFACLFWMQLAWVRGKESPFAPAPSPEEMARRRFTAMMGGSPDDPSELLELQSRGGFGARTLGHSAVTSYYPEDSATSMVPSPRTTPLLGRTLGDRLKYSRFGQFMNTFNTGVSFPNPLV